MRNSIYNQTALRITKEEQKIFSGKNSLLNESLHMIHFLKELLEELKLAVKQTGFSTEQEEIDYFKRSKPQVLGKLLYYNKVYKLETSCPAESGKLYYKHFAKALKNLQLEHKNHHSNTELYQYYRSGRTDMDQIYFRTGHISYHNGLDSFAFEIDPATSTYYDYKLAKIISAELLYAYLISKLTPEDSEVILSQKVTGQNSDFSWSASKNALIELIYALYTSGCISNGKVGIRKITTVFQSLFKVNLGDVHHAFHRMKYRTDSQTVFLDGLKKSLIAYMVADL